MNRFCSILLLMLWLPGPAVALELFGVELEATTRDELREAVKQAGVELIREGGDEQLFDVYDASAVMPGSRRLFLGFEPDSQGLAFVEYEFVGLDLRRLLADLSAKYGEPEVDSGRFLSDRAYHWQRGAIQIRLLADWHNYRTRLSYIEPAALTALLAGGAAGSGEDDPAAEISLY